ncbi:MAG: class I SAM-dependent methyltransferase [Geminicoccaceae bacterium]
MNTAIDRAIMLFQGAFGGAAGKWPMAGPAAFRRHLELRRWRQIVGRLEQSLYWQAERRVARSHYRHWFTEFFGLTTHDYEGVDVLDVGCGPLGSLEWADMAERRVGLDPLAFEFAELGTASQAMEYARGSAEDIPFGDGSFDIVSCFDCLDQVSDLEAAASDILRVTRSGGTILLIVHINRAASFMRPHGLDRSLLALFASRADLVLTSTFAAHPGGDVCRSLRERLARVESEPSILCARLLRH